MKPFNSTLSLATGLMGIGLSCFAAVKPPAPLMPIPTARQLEWQKTELSMFLHFGMNTFTNREWGTGSEDPALFNPARFDAGQWAAVAKAAGFGRVILTAKHHDGFCLWPSRYTGHSVRNTPWKNGKGDAVRDFTGACLKAGLKAGLYLSPWDRHEPSYGDSPAYNAHYAGQLRELLTEYGGIAEVWFDGACGEGPNGKKQEYDFAMYWALVRQLQPGAVMFSDEGPDVRWIGNENGFAGETCWAMMDRAGVKVGNADQGYLNTGAENGPDWVQGECDVSIRKGWFWHPDESPKPLAELLDIYFKSAGRNGILLLNVPPDRDGRIDEKDAGRLMELRSALDRIFTTDFAAGRRARAGSLRGGAEEYGAGMATDGKPGTFWAADDTVRSGWIEADLGRPKSFNVIRIEEPVAFGQRIRKYRVEIPDGSSWQTIVSGTTVGRKKLDRFPAVTADRVRLVIEDARACPLISEFGVHFCPFEFIKK
jgi:alpha-L-fucosidase